MYETEVRERVGRRLTDDELDVVRDQYDDDVSAEACAALIESENERGWERAQERNIEHPVGPSRQDDVREAGRGHLLLKH